MAAESTNRRMPLTAIGILAALIALAVAFGLGGFFSGPQ